MKIELSLSHAIVQSKQYDQKHAQSVKIEQYDQKQIKLSVSHATVQSKQYDQKHAQSVKIEPIAKQLPRLPKAVTT